MKRIISFMLSLAIVLSVMCSLTVSVSAAKIDETSVSFVTKDKIAYNILPDGTAEFCGYLGDAPRLTIPSEIDGHKVTSTAYRGLEGNNTLEQIIIPNTVERIGAESFFGYGNLVDIIIPDSVEFIGKSAFAGTAWINTFADGPVYINNVLYSYLGTIEQGAHFEVREGTVSISDYAFFDDTGIASISLPDTVKYIGADAFWGCVSLESINIPASVEYIDSYAFYNCYGLESIVVDEDNPIYDSRENCNAIIETSTNTLIKGCNNTVVPESVCAIGEMAFVACQKLCSVSLSENVTSIGEQAFSGCKNLSDVEIKADSVDIGMFAFDGTAFYDNLPMGENYINNTFLLYKGSLPPKSEFTVKEGTKSIASNAFANQRNLVSVILPESVEYIGACAFNDCTSLKSVDIKNNVRVISDLAFAGCTEIEHINFPKKLEIIGDGAFSACNNTIFSGELSNVKEIGSFAFAYCYRLTDLAFSADALNIGAYAFTECVSLEYVNFYGTVGNIGTYAFHNCVELTTIAVDAQRITYDAFVGCVSLESIFLYNSICNMPYKLNNRTFESATIYGYNDSSAQSFCEFYNRKFVSLGDDPKKPKLGDVDGDKKITVMDATLVQQYLVKDAELSVSQCILADTDKNGKISVLDVTLIQQYVARIIDKL